MSSKKCGINAKCPLELTGKNLGCVAIMKGNKLAGIITDGDLKRHMTPELLTKTAADLMTADPITSTPDVFANQAVRKMQEKKISVLLVVADGKLHGLLHMWQCLQAGIV